MAEENPVEGEIDKQQIIKEIEQTQLTKIAPSLPEQVGSADSKVATKKLDDEVFVTKITRKRKADAPKFVQQTFWESVKVYRNEVSTLIILFVGTLWLFIAYISKETFPLIIAAVLLFPTILYIFQNFRRGF